MAARAHRLLIALAVLLCAAGRAEAILVIQGSGALVTDRETAVMFAGEPLRIIVQWSGHPERPRAVALGGLDAGLLASIESTAGVFVDAGCLTFETGFLVIGRQEPLDLSSGFVRIPQRASVSLYASLVPCSGPLPPGRYQIRWGTGAPDFASPGDRLPRFGDPQPIESRNVVTPADRFDVYVTRVTSLMMQQRWDAADGALADAIGALASSAEFYHLRAVVAEERADGANALQYAARAVSLIEDRLDTLLFERFSAKDIAERLRLYRAQRDRLRGGGVA